jgi:hypothetical protein
MINQGSDYQHKVARNTGKAKGEKGAGPARATCRSRISIDKAGAWTDHRVYVGNIVLHGKINFNSINNIKTIFLKRF